VKDLHKSKRSRLWLGTESIVITLLELRNCLANYLLLDLLKLLALGTELFIEMLDLYKYKRRKHNVSI
jgi:hypothetical protein